MTAVNAIAGVTGEGFAITALSYTNRLVGAQLTITGQEFGASQGASTVSFGEPVNDLGFAPCTRPAASYVSWSDTSIVVTVPSMSPGKAGEPGTYQRVYVTKGGVSSNLYDFFITPGYTITGVDFVNMCDYGDQGNHINDCLTDQGCPNHDVLLDGCTFKWYPWGGYSYMNGNDAGVITVGQWEGSYNLTFNNCLAKTSMVQRTPVSSYPDQSSNGLKIVAYGEDVRDITFNKLTIESVSRMAVEIVNGNGQTIYKRIALKNSTIYPCGEEGISWDGENQATYSLCADTVLRGYDNRTDFAYYGGYEINGPSHIESRNVTVWSGGSKSLNPHRASGGHSYWMFDGFVVDVTQIDAAQTKFDGTGIGWPDNVHYSRWKNCHFNTGNAGHHFGEGIGFDYLNGMTYTDMSGSTITGTITDTHYLSPEVAENGNIYPEII
jgi:hypothetical protein